MFVKKIPGHMVINRVIVVRNSKSCLVKSDLGKSLDIVFKGVRVLKLTRSRYSTNDWTAYSFLVQGTIFSRKSGEEILEILERSLGEGNVGIVYGSAVLPLRVFVEISKNL